jgi:hypothetical protein
LSRCFLPNLDLPVSSHSPSSSTSMYSFQNLVPFYDEQKSYINPSCHRATMFQRLGFGPDSWPLLEFLAR